jgi:hypothetical protein
MKIQVISLLIVTFCCCGYCFQCPKQRFQRKYSTATSQIDIFSVLISEESNAYLLEFSKSLGQLTLPVAIGVFFVNSIEKQISSVEKQITASKELVEKQITSNKESVEKQISGVDKQIIANKELILANKENIEKQISSLEKITTERIKASEARIESILSRFNQNFRPVGKDE